MGEARQEYQRVLGMEEGCLEAQEGLMDCGRDTGDRNNIELEHTFWLKASEGMEEEVLKKEKTRKDQMCSWLYRQEYYYYYLAPLFLF